MSARLCRGAAVLCLIGAGALALAAVAGLPAGQFGRAGGCALGAIFLVLVHPAFLT